MITQIRWKIQLQKTNGNTKKKKEKQNYSTTQQINEIQTAAVWQGLNMKMEKERRHQSSATDT